jgi:hypothetical protein
MNSLPQARHKEIVVQEFENEILIYDLLTKKAYCLNQTAGVVFTLCNGQRTISEISDLMSQKLKTPASEELVWLTINDLRKNRLIENSAQLSQSLTGQTRREMVKKVGLASMVALPLISSVAAPLAAQAQSLSCVNPGGLSPGSSQSFPGLTCGTSCVDCPCALANCDPKCCSGMAISALDNSSMTLCFC